jgi:competence protein ComEC
MFAAIIAGRPALNLRNVSVAAMVVLLLDPAALLQPGLQMSFLSASPPHVTDSPLRLALSF